MKARVPIRTGGSSKGSTITHGGEFGMRAKKGHRLTAKQLEGCYNILKRKIKIHKGAEIIMRVFPDRPVCVKVRHPPHLQGGSSSSPPSIPANGCDSIRVCVG